MLARVFQWGVQSIGTLFEPSGQSVYPMWFWTRLHRGIISYFVLTTPPTLSLATCTFGYLLPILALTFTV